MKSLLLMCGVAVACGLVAVGCYNPKIEEGAFLCGTGMVCPSGFKCLDGRCRTKAAEPGMGGTGGTVLPPNGCWGNQCVTPSTANLGGACDPICQTGCKCTEKCAIGAAGPACTPVTVQPKANYAVCDPNNDICTPGALCIEDQEGNDKCGSHCFRLCREDKECGGEARCLSEVQFAGSPAAYGLCSNQVEKCNPAAGVMSRCMGGAANDRPLPTFACYILSQREPDLTVCECAGTKGEREPCDRQHDCRPGLECVRLGNESVCRQVCTTPEANVPAMPCRLPTQKCVPFMNGKRFGYCVPI